jgi:hypothetical protein
LKYSPAAGLFAFPLPFFCVLPPVFFPRCGVDCSLGSRLWERVERVVRPPVAPASCGALWLWRLLGRADDTFAMTSEITSYRQIVNAKMIW